MILKKINNAICPNYLYLIRLLGLSIIVAGFFSSCSQLDTKKSALGDLNSSSSNSSTDGTIDFNVHEKTLDNGLKVFIVENKKLPIFSYYTFFEVGGKHEVEGITGASHFLEHMMFKGAKKYGPGQIDKKIEGNGGSNNAYTTNDMTVYYEKMPSEHIDLIIDLEADRMANLMLEEKAFEKERLVVLEERKMRYENSDKGKLYLTMMKNMFEGTPYGTSVIGNIKDLKSVSRDQIYEFFKKFYSPNNAFIFIVGDVDTEHVFNEVEKKFGSLKATENLDELKNENKKIKGHDFKGRYLGRHISLNGTSVDPMFMLAFKGIKTGPRDAYVLDILSSILGDGQSSVLNKTFVLSNKRKASQIYAANYTLIDNGVFFIGGQLLPKVSLKQFKNSLLSSIQSACKNDLTEQSLQKVKNQYLVSLFDGLDTNDGVASFLGNRQAYYGDYSFYKKELGIYNSITVEEIKKSCLKFLRKENSIYLTIWKKHKKS